MLLRLGSTSQKAASGSSGLYRQTVFLPALLAASSGFLAYQRRQS